MAATTKSKGKIVRTQAKGMITIPSEFRSALGIDENSLLQASLVKNGVLFVKIKFESTPSKSKKQETPYQLYSDAQIKEWLLKDKIAPATAARLKKLLKK